ncbi:cephalosporin hydroxylase family protein [Hydrogenophaga sp. R2]|uniref:cephalosporin hydroxylase family protein n=1 Tax=Hydrogenophaga sp. R2 TaxID=3132827 RepID=UPI003CF00BAA
MTPYDKFKSECAVEIKQQGQDSDFEYLTRLWMNKANSHKYSYHFEWMGRPIIQYPQDVIAIQELIWQVKPDLIIETGVAHGGSVILSASLLALLDLSDAIQSGTHTINPSASNRLVVGIDIDIRPHNRKAIEEHPMASRIKLIQGSSISSDVADEVREIAKKFKSTLVFLDSNHTHQHVLEELKIYAPLTSPGSYCVVFDTVIEDMPKALFHDRPWGPGDNPKTALKQYLQENPEFSIDRQYDDKLKITVAPSGFLKRR